MPVPLYRGGSAAVQRARRRHEAGFCHHCGSGHLHARHPGALQMCIRDRRFQMLQNVGGAYRVLAVVDEVI